MSTCESRAERTEEKERKGNEKHFKKAGEKRMNAEKEGKTTESIVTVFDVLDHQADDIYTTGQTNEHTDLTTQGEKRRKRIG